MCMKSVKKFFKTLAIRFSIIHDFAKTIWKFKLWWSLPILFILLLLMVLLLVAGNTGVAAIIYPLF